MSKKYNIELLDKLFILDNYKSMLISDISAHLDIDSFCIRIYLAEMNLIQISESKYLEQVLDLYNNLVSVPQISKITNLNYKKIYKILGYQRVTRDKKRFR